MLIRNRAAWAETSENYANLPPERLMRIPREEFDYLVDRLSLLDLHLHFSVHENLILLSLVNKQGEVVPIQVGAVQQAPKFIENFLIASQNVSVDEAIAQQEDLKFNLAELTGEVPEMPFLTHGYIDFLSETVANQLIIEALDNAEPGAVTPDMFLSFLTILKYLGLKLQVEMSDRHLIVHFVDPSGAYVPLEDLPFYSGCGGFVLSRQDNSARLAAQYKVDEYSEEYKTITGNSSGYLLQGDPGYIIDLIEELQVTYEQEVEFYAFKRKDRYAETEHNHEEFRQELFDFLNPLLQENDLYLVSPNSFSRNDEEVSITEIFDRALPPHEVDFLIASGEPLSLQIDSAHFWGWKTPPGKNIEDVSSTTPYLNVVGIILVDDDTTIRQRKKIIREASAILNRQYPTQPHPMLLTVDPSLLAEWKRTNTPFAPDEAITSLLSTSSHKKALDYGADLNTIASEDKIGLKNKRANVSFQNPPRIYIDLFEPKHSRIGGTQMTFVTQYEGGKGEIFRRKIKLDMGLPFDLVKNWTLGSNPQYVDGLGGYLRDDIFDMQPRLYRLDMLLESLNEYVLNSVLEHSLSGNRADAPTFQSVEEFVLLEIFHRLGEEKFINLLEGEIYESVFSSENLKKNYSRFRWFIQNLRKTNKLGTYLQYISQREKKLYANKEITDLLALTHSHQDHSLGFSLVRYDIPMGLHPGARALLIADHRLASSQLAQEVMVRKVREDGLQGGAYPIQERPYIPFVDGTTVEVSPDVFITGFEEYHSIPFCLSYLVEAYYGRGKNRQRIASVYYGGDTRNGQGIRGAANYIQSNQEKSQFFVPKKNKVDLAIIEGTNLQTGNQNQKKESIHFTEQDVKENFDREFLLSNSDKKLIVIDLVKQAFERLQNIMDVAAARGRDVVLSPKIAHRMNIVQFVLQGTDKVPSIHPSMLNIKIWEAKKKQRKTEEKNLLHMFESVTVDELQRHPERYVVIRENEQPEKLNGLPHDLVNWYDSTYGAYSEQARQEKAYKKRFAQKMGWSLKSKGFHSSGHTPIVTFDHPRAAESALAPLQELVPKTVLPIHTENRGKAAEVFRTHISENTYVYGQLMRTKNKKGRIEIFDGEKTTLRQLIIR